MDFKKFYLFLFLCFPLLAVAEVTPIKGIDSGSVSDTEAAANCIMNGSCVMGAMRNSFDSSGMKQICQAILKSDVCQKVEDKSDLIDCDNLVTDSFEGCTVDDVETSVCANPDKDFIDNCYTGLVELGGSIKDLIEGGLKAFGRGFDWIVRKAGSPVQSGTEVKEAYESLQLYFANEYDRVAKEPSTAVAVRDLVKRNPSSIWGGPLSLDVFLVGWVHIRSCLNFEVSEVTFFQPVLSSRGRQNSRESENYIG